jgi:hypothetical protein
MPRAVLKLLWDTVLDRREIFAYVKNMSMNGDFYWVFAHVTPSFDAKGNVIGFHSSRRVPDSALCGYLARGEAASELAAGIGGGFDQFPEVEEHDL